MVLESLRGPTLERADGRRGGGNQGGGGVIEPSGGWRWALPESRPSPGRCHKSPDICQVALPPAERRQRKTVRSSSTAHVIDPQGGSAKTERTVNFKSYLNILRHQQVIYAVVITLCLGDCLREKNVGSSGI